MSLTRVYEMPSDLEAPMVNFNYTYPGAYERSKDVG